MSMKVAQQDRTNDEIGPGPILLSSDVSIVFNSGLGKSVAPAQAQAQPQPQPRLLHHSC